jgi:bacteriocin biosynthesis cyclodehydratase domain-containing protein
MRPRVKPYFNVQVVDGEGVYLLSETGQIVLPGRRSLTLVPLIDGTRTAEEIVEAASGEFSAAEVYFFLEEMRAKHYIDDAFDSSTSSDRNFWQAMQLDPEDARNRLSQARFKLFSVGDGEIEPVKLALQAFDITIVEDNWDLALVVTSDYLAEGLSDLNALFLAAGKPWMIIKPLGIVAWIGPIFEPGRTGCWECLSQRLRLNREVDTYLQVRLARTEPFSTTLAHNSASSTIGVQLGALEAAKWMAGRRVDHSPAQMLTLNMLTLKTCWHQLVRRPQCPACGDSDKNRIAMPARLELQSRVKVYTSDGGHRSMTPGQLLKSYSHHISPYIGAIRELEKMDDALHEELPVYGAGHNFAVRSINLTFLRRGLRTRSAGKGVTDIQAKASALAEALERYSGLYFGDEERIKGSYKGLKANVIHPNNLMLYSEKQFDNQDEWNSRNLKFSVVPARFDENLEIDWTPVWSLTENCYKYIPTGYLYYNYPLGSTFSFWADSNGNAAGSSLEDAILQGAMELVERDAVAMWWYNRFQRPALNLDSFADPFINRMRRIYDELMRPFWVLDITNDLGVPTFVAVSARTDKPHQDILCAFGSHYDPRLALRRAVTEMNQFLHAVVDMKADGTGKYRFPDDESQHWWQTATLQNQLYLNPLQNAPMKRLVDYPIVKHDDILEDVKYFQQLVESHGMEMLVLNQTRPDIGLPVVKVIVPGLRHFWARYAPGRLYDVPVSLGYQDRILNEDELNPIPCFL